MSFRSRFGSGFPFDDTEDRARTRQRLDDLAQRHPEFAEHLNPDSWGRSRTASSGAEDPFARFRNRARFTDFAFPFDEFDDPREFERFQQQPAQPQAQQQPPQQQQQQTVHQPPQTQPAPVFEKPPTAPDSGKKIQQSNTVDLGQPQAPLVDETRAHRSMSAPPEHPNVASGKRYVNRVTIPNVNAEMGTNASHPPQPQCPPPSEPPLGAPKERIIPIHVEGRDEVVTPSAQAQAQSQQHQQQSQPDRIFGQRPGIFTQFVPPEQPQEDTRQSHADPPPQSPPPAPKPKPTSLDLIQNIQKDVSELMTQVENFNGKPRDKTYMYLDEMLTRKMIMLDDIETGGQDAIRKARKEAIKCIQGTIKVLETKAQANEAVKALEQQAMPDSSADAEPVPTSTTAPPSQALDETATDDVSTTTPGGEHDDDKEMEADECPPADDQEQPKSEAETKEGATEKKRAKRKAAKK